MEPEIVQLSAWLKMLRLISLPRLAVRPWDRGLDPDWRCPQAARWAYR